MSDFPVDYFEDEVRSGFYVPAIMKQLWGVELDILAQIDKVCKKHNIQYFADWGTLLAAVRHEGFVPWDDDIDIAMKREDYNKFLKVANDEMEEGFEVYNYETREDHWLFLARVINKNRICFEEEHLDRFHQFPYIASVDIFVLDYVSGDEDEVKKQKDDFMSTYGQALQTENNNKKRKLFAECEKILGRFSETEASEITQLVPMGLQDKSYCYPKEIYDVSLDLPFENTHIPVPIHYEKMLRMRYGNYMHLNKSAGAHEYPYFKEQQEKLAEIFDFEVPRYKFSASQLRQGQTSKEGFKPLLEECTEGLQTLLMQGDENTLAESQQLAIDMGTLIERFYGEGHPVVAVLEKYCEALYQVSQDLLGLSELVKILEQIIAVTKEQILNREIIVFLPNKPAQWQYMRGLWERYTEEGNKDLFVMPVPYFDKKYDGTLTQKHYELNGYPEQLDLFDYETFNLELLHPDKIIFLNPFDEWNPSTSVHPDFYSMNLQAWCEELIYVSTYDVEEFAKRNEREFYNMQYYVTVPGVVRADKVYVQSEAMKDVYVDKLCEFAGEDNRDIWEKKLCVRDWDVYDWTKEKLGTSDKKSIVFHINASFLVEYKDEGIDKLHRSFMEFEEQQDKVQLLFYPHPQLEEFTTLNNKKIWDEYQILLKKYVGTEWFTLLFGEKRKPLTDCKEALMADAYYGDGSSVGHYYNMAKKPVMIMDVAI